MYEIPETPLLNKIEETGPLSNISNYSICDGNSTILGSLNIHLLPENNTTDHQNPGPTLVMVQTNNETRICWKEILTSRPFVLSLQLQIMWIALFTTMLIVAIVGNVLVMWIILGKSEKTKVVLFRECERLQNLINSKDFSGVRDALNFDDGWAKMVPRTTRICCMGQVIKAL